MRRKWKITLAGLCACAIVTVAYAATAGSQSDPLITLSYLNNTFARQVEDMVDKAVADNQKELEDALKAAVGDSGSFQVVTLTRGQSVVGDVGCELMLRVGTANCAASGSPGLIDTTGGATLNNGAPLEVNHLYMVTVSTRSVTATANTVKLLVRGPYTIQ